MSYTITADSKPDYDEWGPDDYWGAQDWMAWHAAMKAAYGKDEANKRFITAYHEAGFGAVNFDWRTFNSEFKKWAKAEGIYNALFDGIAGIITGVFSSGVTVTDAATDIIDDTAEAAIKTAKLTKWLIPAVLIIVVIGALWWAAKKYKLA